jgi:S-adenosylmethionine:tRNA ribosyltransferase-isomerase
MTKTSTYDYILPKHLIAFKPIIPPTKAKLLVYDRKKDTITHTTFEHILEFIPKDITILFNDTKVIKARIFGKKQSGGKIELLLNRPFLDDTFSCYIKGKVHKDTVIFFDKNLSCKVLKLLDDGSREVKFICDNKIIDFDKLIEILEDIGHIPLPPYINRKDEKSDEIDYQTLWAKNDGAVAAPTASLHFTPKLLGKLKKQFDTSYLTLHIGAGTFKGVECENITDHQIHSEYFDIPKKTQDIIKSDKKILAVGTTVTRTVEYFYNTNLPKGEADIFLHPLNKPKRVDCLLTNFHFPKSTLIMLVASFLGVEKTLSIYQEAIKKQYRFYSYGDGMMII